MVLLVGPAARVGTCRIVLFSSKHAHA